MPGVFQHPRPAEGSEMSDKRTRKEPATGIGFIVRGTAEVFRSCLLAYRQDPEARSHQVRGIQGSCLPIQAPSSLLHWIHWPRVGLWVTGHLAGLSPDAGQLSLSPVCCSTSQEPLPPSESQTWNLRPGLSQADTAPLVSDSQRKN